MASASVQDPRLASFKTESDVNNKHKEDICRANMAACQAVANGAVRTSQGLEATMDKMINNDATSLDKMEVLQPAAKIIVDLSKSQDVDNKCKEEFRRANIAACLAVADAIRTGLDLDKMINDDDATFLNKMEVFWQPAAKILEDLSNVAGHQGYGSELPDERGG